MLNERITESLQQAFVAWECLPSKLPEVSHRELKHSATLDSTPSMGAMYLKALKGRVGLNRDEDVPAFQVESPFTLSESWLNRYLAVCGWENSDYSKTNTIPITAPQAFSAPLHMYLLTHPLFPAATLGVVHAANEMISLRPLSTEDQLTIRAWTGETRWKQRGFEIDLHTAIIANDDVSPSWLGRTTIFRSVKSQNEERSGKPSEDPILDGEREALELSADLGRRYAPIAGDYNPIHLYPLTAKLFGFKRPIIHGMWTVAHLLSRAVPQLEDTQIGRMSVRFKRPLSLPLSSHSIMVNHQEGALMQALDHRGKLAVDLAFSPELNASLSAQS